jgi:superkiller protein 3
MKYIPAVTAAKYYEQGDYANAIQYYLKSVSDGDRRAETFYWLGMSFYKHGDLEDAMLALEMSLEKDTTDVVVLERLAAVNLDLGNFRKAGFYCQKAILVDKQYVEVYNTLAHVFYEGGQLDSAEYYFKYVLTLSKSLRWESLAMKTFVSYADLNAEALNGLGEICIRRGSLFRALDYFGAANSLANNWETPWFNKGRAYEALGNTHAAEIAYERTIDLAPGKTWACKNLARMYHSLHRNSEAMTLYRRAMRIDSTDVESYFGIAELYEENGDKKVAADFYNRAVDKNPDDPRAYSRAARANMLIGKYDVAMELLNEVLQLQPQDADAYNALGEAYRATGDTLQAEKAFEDAIAADSLFAPPLRNLGEILLKRGKESEGLGLHIRAARLGDVKAAEFLRSRGLGWK